MQLSPVFCYVSLPGLYLARVYEMQQYVLTDAWGWVEVIPRTCV